MEAKKHIVIKPPGVCIIKNPSSRSIGPHNQRKSKDTLLTRSWRKTGSSPIESVFSICKTGDALSDLTAPSEYTVKKK